MGFILLSHQRSMSSFFMNILRAHPDLSLLNEPLGQHLRCFRTYDLFSSFPSPITPLQKKEEKTLRGYVDSLKRWISCSDQMIGFKEVLLLNKATWIRQHFSGYKIIVLVRDPRAVVEALIRRNLDKRWRYGDLLKTYFSQTSGQLQTFPDNRVGQCAWIWKLRLYGLLENWQLLADNMPILLLHAEDLVQDLEGSLHTTMKFLEKEIDAHQIQYAQECWSEERGGLFSNYHKKAHFYAWKKQLSTRHQYMVEQIAGKEMVQFGYLSTVEK